MLPLSVLTLALLGGFIFVTQWYPTRYYTLRSEGYRLLFLAAIFGTSLLLLASILIQVTQMLLPGISESIGTLWERFILPMSPEGLSRAAIAFLLGASLWYLPNLLGKWSNPPEDQPEPKFYWLRRQFYFLSDEAAIYRAIKSKDDPLETFLAGALPNPSRQILVTVKNGKVYVGNLRKIFNPAFPVTSIGMVLSRSGHREVGNQQMQIDVDYAQTIRNRLRPRLIQRLLPQLIQRRIGELLRENPNMDDEELVKKATSEFSSPEFNESLRKAMEAELEAELETELKVELENYRIFIPLTEVQSVNFFDENVHEDYKNYFPPAPGTDSVS